MDTLALKDTIASIFESSRSQEEALERVYGLFFSGEAAGAGKCGERLYRYLTALFSSFDYERHPDRPPGGLWHRRGFLRDRTLPPWTAVWMEAPAPCSR